jgi:hypothetical protein
MVLTSAGWEAPDAAIVAEMRTALQQFQLTLA